MTKHQQKIAIVFPAGANALAATRVEDTRLKGVAQALASAGAQVVSAPFCDEIAGEIGARLVEGDNGVDLVLVWYNPVEAGRDRSRLNAMLRAVAAQGIKVSAHPDVIDKIGTKDVLWNTRHMDWGTAVKRYADAETMRAELLLSLQTGSRVLKQMRGQSGDGVWQVSRQEAAATPLLAVRHAARGSAEQLMSLDEFVALCSPYFAHGGAMIDQPYQARLQEGMIRCYMVGDKVAGFGEQLINALYPASTETGTAPEPGSRLYFPANRPDFQPLKRLLEGQWIAQMCDMLAIQPEDLPVLWDADFIRGPKTIDGQDTYVLCEINISSVYPFPPSALEPMVAEALNRCASRL